MRGQPFYIGPWNGINLRDRLLEIPINELPAASNCIGNVDGTISKRKPCVNRISFSGVGANDITSLSFIEGALGVPVAFLGAAGTKMYLIDLNGGSAAPISGALVLPSALSARWTWIKAPVSGAQGPFYGLSGDSAYVPKQWDGSGAAMTDWTASAGTLEPGAQMIFFKNRVIMWGFTIPTTSAPATAIKASKVGDPRNWDTTVSGADSAWQTAIDPNDGGPITGIAAWKSYLLVFKESKVYLVYDLDSGANRSISNNLGTADRKTICSTPYGITFINTDGQLYITDGVKFTKISDNLRGPGSASVMDLPVTSWPWPWNEGDTATCAFADDKLYYSNGIHTWVYDFVLSSWWYYGGVPLAAMAVRPGTNLTTSEIYGTVKHTAGLEAPLFWQLFTLPTSNAAGNWRDGVSLTGVGGTAYTAFFDTIPLAPMYFRRKIFQDYIIRRRYHAMRGYISGVVTVMYALDSLNAIPTYTALGTTAYGTGTETAQQNTYYSLGVGNALRLRFTSADGNAWAVHPFAIFTQPRTD